jgi:hypothetical protein
MLKKQKEHLIETIRAKLEKGGVITIYGWKASNHSNKTLAYKKTERIEFVDRRNRIVGVHSDLIIFVEFIKHSDQQKMKAGFSLYPHPVSIGVLKKILIACEDVIVPTQKLSNDDVLKFVEKTHTEVSTLVHEDIDELEKYLNHTEVKMETIDTFAEVFKKESLYHADALVSSIRLGILLRENNIGLTPTQLVKKDWIERVTQEGKQKAGWYRATLKLQKKIDAGKQKEPDNGIEKALFLIQQKPFFEQKLVELEREFERESETWKEQIRRAEAAEVLLQKLNDV